MLVRLPWDGHGPERAEGIRVVLDGKKATCSS